MSDAQRCLIHAAPVGHGQYKWSWSTSCGSTSGQYFRHFHDCVVDAAAHGYSVDVQAVVEHLKSSEERQSGKLDNSPRESDAVTPSKSIIR
jgi:hypothetical protein